MARFGERAKSARRKAEARIRQLERDIGKLASSSEIRNQRSYIESIRETISETRMFIGGKKVQGRTATDAFKAVLQLEEINKEITISRKRDAPLAVKSNAVVGHLISSASHGKEFGGFTEVEARLFFKATQNLWQGTNPKTRYETIMEKLGVSSLEDVYNAFKKANKNVIDVLEKVKNGEELDPVQAEMYAKLKGSDDSQEKRYDNRNIPIGAIASSNYVEVTTDLMQEYLG